MKTPDSKSTVDASGIHLWLVLWKAFRSIEAHAVRHIAEMDMCLSDFGALEVLLHKGPLTIKELGAKVMLTSGSMTAALDRLERRGLIERTGDEDDRRIRRIRLTRAGNTLIHEAFEEHKQVMEQAVAGVARKDRLAAIELLKQLGMYAAEHFAMDEGKSVAAKSGKKK